MKISSSPQDEIITYALGSCLGITIYDPVAQIGAMVHVMLPSSSIDPVKANANPCMFVDTGVKKLFLDSYKTGAQRNRLIVLAAGGACANGLDQDDYFQIGKRNVTVLRNLLWKNGIILNNCDFGRESGPNNVPEYRHGRSIIRTNGLVRVLSSNGGNPR